MGVVAAVLTAYLLVFWKVDYSVYKMPFNSIQFDMFGLGIYAYRFSLGFCGSLLFIIIAQTLTKYKLFMQIAKLGKYTLVMYTVSVICKYLIQDYIMTAIVEPIYLESLSLVATVLLILLSVGLTKLFERNKYSSFLFLGQKNIVL